MHNNTEIIQQLQTICRAYADILGRVILFGSYSRGEANEGSDIDLYIEPKDIKMTTEKFGKNKRYKDFKYALYGNFNTEFDLLSYGGIRDITSMRKSPLWEQIEKDGILIYDQESEVV